MKVTVVLEHSGVSNGTSTKELGRLVVDFPSLKGWTAVVYQAALGAMHEVVRRGDVTMRGSRGMSERVGRRCAQRGRRRKRGLVRG